VFTAVADKAAGSIFTEADWDTFLRDNLNKGVMRPIAEVTLASPAALIDFTSIAADWSHLQLIAYLRGDTAAAETTVLARLNNDSGANYDYQSGTFSAAVAAAAETLAATSMRVGQCPANTAGANLFSLTVIDLVHYAGATNHKVAASRCAHKRGTASGDLTKYEFGGHWRSTAAINRVTLLPGAGNFQTGSRITLYGMGGI
jgi:hypothetical protein